MICTSFDITDKLINREKYEISKLYQLIKSF